MTDVDARLAEIKADGERWAKPEFTTVEEHLANTVLILVAAVERQRQVICDLFNHYSRMPERRIEEQDRGILAILKGEKL